MKNNRTNRKLKFIREKNNLRLGKRPFTSFHKVTNELLNDAESFEYQVNLLMNTIIKHVFNYYKIRLKYSKFTFGEQFNDFIKNQKTLRIELTNKI